MLFPFAAIWNTEIHNFTYLHVVILILDGASVCILWFVIVYLVHGKFHYVPMPPGKYEKAYMCIYFTTWYSKVWAVVSILCPGYGHFLYHFHSIYSSWHFTRKEYCTEKWQVYSYNLRSCKWGFKSLSKALLCFLYFSLRAVGILLIGKRKEQKFYSIFMCFVLGPL